MSISVEHRRRLLAERQMLGEHGRSARSVDDVARRLGLLHSTDPAVPYLSLHARCDATVDDVASAFYVDRTLFRITTLRRTVFAMPLDVAPLAVNAYNAPMARKARDQLERWLVENSEDVDLADVGAAAAFLDEVDHDVIEHLRTRGGTTGAALAEAVPELQVTFDPMPGKSYSKPTRITSKVLEILAAEGRIARGEPSGDLTSGAWSWEAIEQWLPDGIADIDADDALASLMERYLRAFGPVTVTDAAWWTGLTKTAIRRALSAIDADEVELEAVAEPGFVDSGDALDAGSASDSSVALLPGLDPTTMGWKQRSWYVDDDPATGVFDKNGNAGPTIWLGGRVVGVWTQRSDGSIATEILDGAAVAAGDVADAIDAEATRMADWLGDVRVNWRYPTPITRRLEL